METTFFWTNIPSGIWVLGGILITSLGTLLSTYILKRSEERKHLNLLVMNAAIENWKKGSDMVLSAGKGEIAPLDAYIIHMMKLSQLFFDKSLDEKTALAKLKQLSKYSDYIRDYIEKERMEQITPADG